MEWISVKNQLPQESNDYLIFTTEGMQYVANWSKKWPNRTYWEWLIRCECCNAEDCLLIQDMVLFWMPLPNPPKD